MMLSDVAFDPKSLDELARKLAESVPPGLTVTLTYDGSPNAPTNAGSYEVIGTVNELNYAGSATNTLVIAASNAPVSLGNLAAVYDGSGHAASAVTVPSGLPRVSAREESSMSALLR